MLDNDSARQRCVYRRCRRFSPPADAGIGDIIIKVTAYRSVIRKAKKGQVKTAVVVLLSACVKIDWFHDLRPLRRQRRHPAEQRYGFDRHLHLGLPVDRELRTEKFREGDRLFASSAVSGECHKDSSQTTK